MFEIYRKKRQEKKRYFDEQNKTKLTLDFVYISYRTTCFCALFFLESRFKILLIPFCV